MDQFDQRFLFRFIAFLNEHTLRDKEVTFRDIAKAVDSSDRNFYRKTKKLTNLTPSEFINIIRFGEAREMVLFDYDLKEILFKINVDSKSYFYKSFKGYFNMSPKVLKESSRKEKNVYDTILNSKVIRQNSVQIYYLTIRKVKFDFYNRFLPIDVALILSSYDFQQLLMKSYLEKIYNKINP